jgi:hypothetical protein
MQFGAVALVLAEAILRKLRAEVTHHPIARDLGDDAGRRDRKAEAIAIDNGGLRQGKRDHGQPVDEDMLGRVGKRFEGEPHGPVCGAQDIDPIDLQVINHSHGPDDLDIADQFAVNFFALFGRELL